MSSEKRTLFLVALISLATAAHPVVAHSQAACPSICGCGYQCSQADVGIMECPPYGYGSSGGGWNLHSGSLNATGFMSGCFIQAADSFFVVSTPGGRTIELTLVLNTGGDGYSGGIHGRVSIPLKGSLVDAFEFPPLMPPLYLTTHHDSTQQMSFSVEQGERFLIEIECGAGGGTGGNPGYGSGGVNYRILPVAGVDLVSCHHYDYDASAPNLRSTWGALKARYR